MSYANITCIYMIDQNIQRKKILYLITQSELGGAQKYVFDLATGLKCEFEISVAFGEQGEKGELVNLLDIENIPFFTIPHLKRNISPFNDLMAVFEIIKLINKIKPDIVHLNSTKVSILGSIAYFFLYNFYSKSTFDIRHSTFLYTAHGWVFNEPMGKLKKIFYKYAEKLSASAKNKIICVSEFDRQTAIKEKIAPEKKLITIHNGIAPIVFYSREEAINKINSIIRNSELGIRDYLIASIGNLYPTKGYEYAIKAVHLLINNSRLTTPDSQLLYIIFGEGEDRPKLESLIKKYGLEKNIILAGRVPDASRLLKAFDIYLCSSVKEGLSYTLIEAMQAGLPIVATRVGGNTELVEDSKSGLIAKPADPEDLADKISILIKNLSFCEKLSIAADRSASADFCVDRMLEQTKKIYAD
jgi:glycosyltransferase involved in cell wall biosynthesis